MPNFHKIRDMLDDPIKFTNEDLLKEIQFLKQRLAFINEDALMMNRRFEKYAKNVHDVIVIPAGPFDNIVNDNLQFIINESKDIV